MKAELTYSPESGKYEEIHFEQPTVWNSQTFSWVKFEDQECNDWYGSFRGAPLGHLAISEITGNVLIPTEDGTYLVSIQSRELIRYYGVEYQIQNVILAPDERSFVLASHTDLYRISDDYELILLPCQVDMDMIKLVGIDGDNIQFEYEEIGVWKRKAGILNTKEWEIK